MEFLRIKQLSKKYPNQAQGAIRNLSFTFHKGQFISILGESGAGKTTLLKIIAGIEQADSGAVWFQNEKVKGPQEQLLPGHPKIALVQQDMALAHRTKVELNIKQPLRGRNIPYTEIKKRTAQLLKLCEIGHLKNKYVEELSGGEQQRLAIARALVSLPEVVLLDEPFSHLNLVNKQIIKELLERIRQAYQLSIIMVTHDYQDALSMSDLVIVINKGKILQKGTPEELYNQPVNLKVAKATGPLSYITDGIKKHYLRPESIKITTIEAPDTIKASILKRHFHGAYYSFIVRTTLDQTIQVVSSEDYGLNQTLYLHFSEPQVLKIKDDGKPLKIK